MSWSQSVPALLVAALIYLVPGAAVLRAAGVRGLRMWALAAPVTISVVSCLAVAAAAVGVRFSLGLTALTTAALTVVVLLVRVGVTLRTGGTRSVAASLRPRMPRAGLGGRLMWLHWGAQVAAFVIPAGIIALRFTLIWGSPEYISQTYDDIFHLNAVRYIVDLGSGSSLTIGNLTDASAAFYPAAWHDMAALVDWASGVSIPAASTVNNIVIAAIVWPLSCLFLISRVVGNRVLPMLITGAMAAGFSAFPYLTVDFGVLYPNLLGIAVAPVALGLAIEFLGVDVKKSRWPGPLVLLLVTLPGLTLAHPTLLFALTAFGFPVLLYWLYRRFRAWRAGRSRTPAMVLSTVLLPAYLAVAVAAWTFGRQPASASQWQPTQTPAQSLGEIVANAPLGRAVSWPLLIATVAGIVVLLRRPRQWWVLGMLAMGGFLFMVASAWEPGPLRSWLTGVWYNDPHRLAELLPIVALPVAVVGADTIIRWLASWVRGRFTTGPGKNAAAVATLAAVALVLVACQTTPINEAQRLASVNYGFRPDSILLTTDEYELIKRVPQHVPANDTVYGDPWTGASLVWALADRRTTAPHVVGARSAAENIIMSELDEAGSNPAVCPVVRASRTFYALRFPSQEILFQHHSEAALDHADTAPGLELVDKVGQAKLYRVTACGQG